MTDLLVVHKRLSRWPVDKWLGAAAANTVLVTTRSAHAKGGSYESFQDVILLDDYEAPDVHEHLLRLAVQRDVSRVAGAAEVDVVRLAKVRNELGLPGLSLSEALEVTDKLLMRMRVAGAGLPSPRFWAASSLVDGEFAQLRTGVSKYLAKPRTGSGSRGITVLGTVTEVEEWLLKNAGRLNDYIIEEFVDGPILHIDGLCRDGRVLHSWPSAYGETPLRAHQANRTLSSWILDPDDPRVKQTKTFANEVIRALPPMQYLSAFHLEVIAPSASDLVFCEIGMRPAGGGTDIVFSSAFSYSTVEAHIRGQLGMPTAEPPLQRPRAYGGWSMLFPVSKSVNSVPPLPKGLSILHAGLPVAGRIAVRDGEAAGVVVVAGDNLPAVRNSLARVETWWDKAIDWA